MDDFRETRGLLEYLTQHPERVMLGGWAAPWDPPSIHTFEVTVGGVQVPCRITRAESPDVKAAFPALFEGDKARVFLELDPVRASPAAVRDRLLRVTPVFEIDGRREIGCHIYRVLESRLPMPDEALLAKIGGGGGDVSFEFLAHFIQRAGLEPRHHVLDVGCGVGRMAYGLAYYLDPSARYEGFDIMEECIAWANGAIASRVPSFRFAKADVWNSMYNPHGQTRAADYRFPYEDRSFDFLFLTSVFTHMHASDMRHYVDEFARVLRPGGRALVTCFLCNDESRSLIAAGQSTQDLVHPLPDAWTSNPAVPEAAIGFDEKRFFEWFAERGFRRIAYYPGSWCGRRRAVSYQDITVFEKTATGAGESRQIRGAK